MAVEIHRANIEHLKKLLDAETDPKKRGLLKRQLAEEEVRLAVLLKAQGQRTED